MEKKKIVYIAGKISNDPCYREKFAFAEERLKQQGYVVVSPSVLPSGLNYSSYIKISTAMLDECDYICLLPDWAESEGAVSEQKRAELLGIKEVRCPMKIVREALIFGNMIMEGAVYE